jgi:putative transposase
MYQLMRSANLLLQQCTAKRIDRTHDGVVRTLHSKTRWCSDGFEIHC